ncbi:MAG: class I SAM-dependent methyltransferase [Acidobacteriaceae bacterium]|nr:class I SAM-dependent methyltransferase [Acidobacteriaceae bacterium]MBV9779407.1 class I SAM-dependent methyltransferase [Acidobacteriaceae bacterium]
MQAEQIRNATALAPSVAIPARLEKALVKSLPEGTAFELQMPGQPLWRLGDGTVKFRVIASTKTGASAIKSLDEIRIAEAYLSGDLDIEGDLLAAFDLRNSLSDSHMLAYLWSTYGQRLFFGQAASDRKWVNQHYDTGADLHLYFLDKQSRCYSHGYFERHDEPLESAIQRKLTTAFDSASIQPGMRVLDVGCGWGSFMEFAGKRGARVTSLTISNESEVFCNELIRRENLPCEVVLEHFLEYKNTERFDAIINLGVTEHLPDYPATLAQYSKLLKPGGRVYLDASASPRKYPFSRFILKYIYPGNETPLHLPSYLDAVCESPFELYMVQNDRISYMLTAKHWAENLDSNRSIIAARWGEPVYRRFRLYLWGCVHCFATDDMTAYHWMLQLSAGNAGRTALTRKTPATILKRTRRALHS